jgi:Putative transposase DNA-binding domain
MDHDSTKALPRPSEDEPTEDIAQQETTASGTTKVYVFPCKFAYAEEAALFEHQLTLSHRHRNKLTEIYLQTRQAFRQTRQQLLGEDLDELEQQAKEIEEQKDQVKEEINKWKTDNRSKKVPQELKAAHALLQQRYTEVSRRFKSLKQAAKEHPELNAFQKQLNARTNSDIQTLRKEYSQKLGLFWPNYLQNERAARQAQFQPCDPKFHRWTGEGQLAIQIQNGLSPKELFDCQSQLLRLIPPDPSYIRANGAIRGRAGQTKALFRIESTGGSTPRWVTLNVLMTRALPENGLIKWAFLKRKKKVSAAGKTYVSITRDYDYYLCLMVSEPPSQLTLKGKVALEVGWRLMEGGLRVAVYYDGVGSARELYLPATYVDRWNKKKSLESIIDQLTNETKREILKTNPELGSKFALAVNKKGQENTRRVANILLSLYRSNPKFLDRLERWRRKHLHLIRYKSGLEDRLIRQRTEIYRRFANELGKKYSVGAMEDFDLRKVSRNSDETNLVTKAAKWQQKLAAISTLKAWLSRRMTLVKFPAKNTTKKCHACLSIEEFDAASELVHRCKCCNAIWDQDHNAVFNIWDALEQRNQPADARADVISEKSLTSGKLLVPIA